MIKSNVLGCLQLHHCVFSTEFLYQHLMEDYNTQKLITVYDLGGANLGDLKGEVRLQALHHLVTPTASCATADMSLGRC